MAFVLTYNSILQVVAAFVIFVLGYLLSFVFLIVSLLIATSLYQGAIWIRAHMVKSAINSSVSSDFALPVHHEKGSVILAWTHKLIDGLAPGR
jgi:hypothetical protein